MPCLNLSTYLCMSNTCVLPAKDRSDSESCRSNHYTTFCSPPSCCLITCRCHGCDTHTLSRARRSHTSTQHYESAASGTCHRRPVTTGAKPWISCLPVSTPLPLQQHASAHWAPKTPNSKTDRHSNGAVTQVTLIYSVHHNAAARRRGCTQAQSHCLVRSARGQPGA
jgi:hypothetical protein